MTKANHCKTYHEVIQINDERQTVTVLNHQTNQTFEESYDTLILSPGASANRLNTHSDISFTVRNLEDTETIDTFITNTKAQRALVVGAGYISLEVLKIYIIEVWMSHGFIALQILIN